MFFLLMAGEIINMQVNQLKNKLIQQLSTIYKDVSLEQSFDQIAQALIDIMGLSSKVTEIKQKLDKIKLNWIYNHFISPKY